VCKVRFIEIEEKIKVQNLKKKKLKTNDRFYYLKKRKKKEKYMRYVKFIRDIYFF